ncbi:hypothetical protein A2Y99_00160 [Candidatus Gottesmanbacteria bacterium RBG_13_37_7]|uniref:RNA polymerase sigma factor n=1 Tax=Candidatus Gottesmanbacteria bacterium RBG_13_37_7 TaxID=1798369 RepID=A0A1F5YGY5_9BACT|nr:MAG: hypothetical protein A2Y99_00160 [Candidatus Gottesmanbacteria bacterium RBG_13_37_7]
MNEKELVSNIVKGNEKALFIFYHRFLKPLEKYVSHKVEDENDVEEIVQDVFFAAIEAFRDFSFRSSVFTFLCSIANHKVIDFYRRKKIKKVVFSKISDIEPLIATFLGPEEKFNEVLIKEKISETLQKITPKYGYILKLKYIYGYSVAEMAEKLSVSFKTIESRLFRARKAFVEAYLL